MVEGKKRHTGPKAFAAMRQHEVRTTKHNYTPSNKAGQPGRHKATRHPEGGTSVQTGPGRHTGGREATIGREASRQQPNKKDRYRGVRTPTERSTTTIESHQQSRKQKHRHDKTTNTERPSHEKKHNETRDKRRQGEYGRQQSRTRKNTKSS